jgi:hypothetical protein
MKIEKEDGLRSGIGRPEAFSCRVRHGFGDRLRMLAKEERLLVGEMLEKMLDAWEAQRGAGGR